MAEEQALTHKLRYFIAVFGEKHAKEYPIHGGCYPIDSTYGDASKVTTGDIMLVYCTASYKDEAGYMYDKESPGIARVTHVSESGGRVSISYNYESFDTSIERVDIMACLTQDEKWNFRWVVNRDYWLREIGPASFQCIMGKAKSVYNNSNQSTNPSYKFTVVVEKDEDGLYVASVPLLQGCYTQGETYEEALENIKDAIKLHIEARRALGEPIPIEVAIDEVQVVV